MFNCAISKLFFSLYLQVYLDDNHIKSTECECPRGAYKCSHSAAIVIHAIHNLSRTDVECCWKKQKTPQVTKAIEELYPSKGYEPFIEDVSDGIREEFYQDLKTYGRFTGMAWILSPEPAKPRSPITTVEDIILSEEFVESDLSLDYFLEKLKITEEKREEVHDATLGQRENPTWHMLRKGRLTASNFGDVLNAKRATKSLLSKVLGEYDISGVHAITWGINNKAEGVRTFKEAKKLEVQESGLWLKLSGILGASPDGLVADDGILEVKCPYSHRERTIDEAINYCKLQSKEFHLQKLTDGSYELKRNHRYWHQVQGQLYLTGRRICYFVTWTPKESLVLAIEKDHSWSDNLDLLEDFFKVHMFPKLIEG